MSEQKGLKSFRYNKKSIMLRLAFVFALIILAGIATLVVPQGEYLRETVDGHTVIVEDSFRFLEGKPLPVWRWLTAPFEALVGSSGVTAVMIIVCMLLMGGVMVLLDESKIMVFMVSAIIRKYGKNRYKLMYAMAGIMMFIGSTISFYNQSAIFIPLAVGICFAIGWDSLMGIGLSFLPIAMGFAVGTVNPYNVAIPQSIAGLPINSGIAVRVLLLVVFYLIYVTFLRGYAKKIEKDPTKAILYESDKKLRGMFPNKVDDEVLKDSRIRRGVLIFAGFIGLIFVFTGVSLLVPGLSEAALPVMIISLTAGGVLGARSTGRVKGREIGKNIMLGAMVTSPAAIVIILILGIRQIIIGGQIMDTLLYYAYSGLGNTGPYAAIFIILGLTMAMELVVGSASTKAFLILPLLVPLGNMIGLTSQTIVQAYMFGDSFSNAFYPTSTMVLMISGLIDMPLVKWYQWTWKLIVAAAVFVALALLFCVRIGFGPF